MANGLSKNTEAKLRAQLSIAERVLTRASQLGAEYFPVASLKARLRNRVEPENEDALLADAERILLIQRDCYWMKESYEDGGVSECL